MALMQLFEASLADSLNPMNGMLRDFAATSTKAKQEEITALQLETISKISQLMAQAKEDNAPDEVIQAYAKVLARYK